jgi:hypothetical protein
MARLSKYGPPYRTVLYLYVSARNVPDAAHNGKWQSASNFRYRSRHNMGTGNAQINLAHRFHTGLQIHHRWSWSQLKKILCAFWELQLDGNGRRCLQADSRIRAPSELVPRSTAPPRRRDASPIRFSRNLTKRMSTSGRAACTLA